jgi:hypothetical protein
MFHWVFDNIWIFYVLLVAVAAALGYLWWANQTRGLLIATGVVSALLVLLFLLSWLIVTDREEMTNAVYEMAGGVSANEPDRVVKHLAKDFSYRSLNKAAVATAINQAVTRWGIGDVIVWNFKFDQVSREDKSARVQFHMRVTDRDGLEVGFALCRCEFVIEDGHWRMQSIKFYKPFTDSDQEIPVPVP